MGLAASQARLLSLTSRQHTVELRAQYYQAQKLRLANDSDSAYERYITALDATKYQTKFYSSDKKLHWVDASLNNLMRYDNLAQYTGNTYFVQNIDNGMLYVQQDIYDAYMESEDNIEEYFNKLNIDFENDVHTQEYIFAQEAVDYDISQGWNNNEHIYEYNQLKANIASPDMSQYEKYNAAKNILNILNSTYGIYLSNNNENYDNLKNNLATLKNSDYNTDDIKDIITYCEGFTENADYTKLDLGKENLKKFKAYSLHHTDSRAYIVYDKDNEDSLGNELKITDNAILLRLLLNGGTCYKNDNSNSENIYGNDITSKLDNYLQKYNLETGNSEEVLSVGDALKYFCKTIKNSEIAIAKENAQAELDDKLVEWGMTADKMEMRIYHYDEYIQDLTILQSCNQETYRAFPDGQEIGENYELIFNAITAAGGCIAISDENAKSGAWVTNMVKNVQVILTKYNNEENDLDTISVSQNGGLREISNDEDLKRAENEYDTILDEITEKEKKYDIKLSQLEAERNAIETEKESLKQVANDNIESTFRLFS